MGRLGARVAALVCVPVLTLGLTLALTPARAGSDEPMQEIDVKRAGITLEVPASWTVSRSRQYHSVSAGGAGGGVEVFSRYLGPIADLKKWTAVRGRAARATGATVLELSTQEFGTKTAFRVLVLQPDPLTNLPSLTGELAIPKERIRGDFFMVSVGATVDHGALVERILDSVEPLLR